MTQIHNNQQDYLNIFDFIKSIKDNYKLFIAISLVAIIAWPYYNAYYHTKYISNLTITENQTVQNSLPAYLQTILMENAITSEFYVGAIYQQRRSKKLFIEIGKSMNLDDEYITQLYDSSILEGQNKKNEFSISTKKNKDLLKEFHIDLFKKINENIKIQLINIIKSKINELVLLNKNHVINSSELNDYKINLIDRSINHTSNYFEENKLYLIDKLNRNINIALGAGYEKPQVEELSIFYGDEGISNDLIDGIGELEKLFKIDDINGIISSEVPLYFFGSKLLKLELTNLELNNDQLFFAKERSDIKKLENTKILEDIELKIIENNATIEKYKVALDLIENLVMSNHRLIEESTEDIIVKKVWTYNPYITTFAFLLAANLLTLFLITFRKEEAKLQL